MNNNPTMYFGLIYRVVKHSERPLAYAIDWLSQRVLGEFTILSLGVSTIHVVGDSLQLITVGLHVSSFVFYF